MSSLFFSFCCFDFCVYVCLFVCFLSVAVHCNLSQNGIDHQVCSEDVSSQLEEEPVEQESLGLDEDSPAFPERSPGFQRRSLPQRSVSESELSKPGNVKLSKPVALWTQQDVCKWLKKHCPNQHQIYSDSFKQHDITGKQIKNTACMGNSFPPDTTVPGMNQKGFFMSLWAFGPLVFFLRQGVELNKVLGIQKPH
ncbi:hypothetical protein ACEWY4_024024 [Coilia grayii]|uniref:SAM domain-containing protein n=1 Tax=Coilia grayii TaxID=363190 RepID=A0ABD1IZ50_9TELE